MSQKELDDLLNGYSASASNPALTEPSWPSGFGDRSLSDLPGPARATRDFARDAQWGGTPQATWEEAAGHYLRPIFRSVDDVLQNSGAGLAGQFLIPGARGGKGAAWHTTVPREGAPVASLDVGGREFIPRLPPADEGSANVLGGILARQPGPPANANAAEVIGIGPRATLDNLKTRMQSIEDRMDQLGAIGIGSPEWKSLQSQKARLQSQADAILVDRALRGEGGPEMSAALQRHNSGLMRDLTMQNKLTLMQERGYSANDPSTTSFLQRLKEADDLVRSEFGRSQPGKPIPGGFGVYRDRPPGRFDDGYGGRSGLGVPPAYSTEDIAALLRAAYGEGMGHE